MKAYHYLLIVALLLPSCKGGKRTVQGKVPSSSQVGDTKPNCTLLMGEPSFESSSDDPAQYIVLDLLLINNNKDTVKFWGTDCLFSKLYHLNSKAITILDDHSKSNNALQLIIPPNEAVETKVKCTLGDTGINTVKFRVGMNLINWGDGEQHDLHKLPAKADMVWSDVAAFKTTWVTFQGRRFKSRSFETPVKSRDEFALKKPLPFFYILTQQDKKQYILSIDQHQIKNSKTADFEFIKKKYETGAIVPVKLTNNSPDTLEYINMTCDWTMPYHTNNKRVQVSGPPVCESNYPTIINVAPYQTSVVNLPVTYVAIKGSKQRFRIGMGLQKFTNGHQIVNFDPSLYRLRTEPSNMLWSNEVETP